MFGGFGGPPGQQPGAGFPGMTANVNITETTTTSTTSGATGGMQASAGMGGAGGSDPGKKSQEMQDRYKHREAKLPTYIALIDVLESKGENVGI